LIDNEFDDGSYPHLLSKMALNDTDAQLYYSSEEIRNSRWQNAG
jgi:hypothetical protein